MDERHLMQLRSTRDYLACHSGILRLSVAMLVMGLAISGIVWVALVGGRADYDFLAALETMFAKRTVVATWVALTGGPVIALIGLVGLLKPLAKSMRGLGFLAIALGLAVSAAAWFMRDAGMPFCGWRARPAIGYATAALYPLGVVVALCGALARNFGRTLHEAVVALDGRPSAALLEQVTVTHHMLQSAGAAAANKVVSLRTRRRQYNMLLDNPYCIVARRGGKGLGFVSIRDLRIDVSSSIQTVDPTHGAGRTAQCTVGKEYSAAVFGVQSYIEDPCLPVLLGCFLGLGSSGVVVKGNVFLDDRSLGRYKTWSAVSSG